MTVAFVMQYKEMTTHPVTLLLLLCIYCCFTLKCQWNVMNE